jgi:Ca2+/Na+ antiporter
MQSILSPLFIIFAVKLWSVDLSNSDEISFRGWALGVCLSASCFTAAFLFTRPHRHILRLAQHSVTNPPSPSTTASTAPTLPWHHPILSFIGFCVGIVWIYVIATEVVGLLKAFGVILDISEAILGMTVFAFGNSIGDFVSNITMARMGYPHMALAASFAGPLLNLLMTLGISGMLGLNEPPREFVLTTNAFLTTFGLLLMQVINLIAIPCQRYRVSRSYGLFLVVLYISIITVTVTLSFTDVQLPFLHPNDSE